MESGGYFRYHWFLLGLLLWVRGMQAACGVHCMSGKETKLETFINQTKETYATGQGISVTVSHWANCEGCNLMVHGKGEQMPLRMAGAFRWEEIDIFLAALAVARAG